MKFKVSKHDKSNWNQSSKHYTITGFSYNIHTLTDRNAMEESFTGSSWHTTQASRLANAENENAIAGYNSANAGYSQANAGYTQTIFVSMRTDEDHIQSLADQM